MTDLTQMAAAPAKIRYAKFSGDSGWIPCVDATVREGVLVIKLAEDSMDMIPLHVIRGPIEVRPNGEEVTDAVH